MRVSPPSRLDCGILLVSCSVLLVELLLTRIFSVTMFYHLSFMVVSLAMLGFGASGLLVNLFPQRFREENLAAQLVVSCIFFAVTTVAAIGASFLLPVSLETTAENWMRVGAVYALCAIPFVAGGLVVSLILTHHAKQANRLYFFDLLGAALGCLAFIPATNVLGAPTAVLAAAALAASAGVVLGRGVGRLRLAALGTAAVLVVLAIVNTREGFYDVRFIKGSRQPPTLAMKWNSFSRVDVVGTKEELWNPKPPVFAGFSAKLDPEYAVAEVWLRYDADANTQITRFTGDPSTLTHLQYDVSSTAYQMRTYHDVLIIGPGGGRDILTALHMGSGPVTGVEINPITLSLLRTRFKTFSGGLYNDYPGVHMVNDEGRSFLRHGSQHYDLIQASLVDTRAASAAGAYALTENNLYTVEAFEDYLQHLTPDGVVSFTRWFSRPPVESLRVVSLAMAALNDLGVKDPAEHVFVIRTNPEDVLTASLGSILVKHSAFTAAEVAKLRAWAQELGFIVEYAPGTSSEPATDFDRLLGTGSAAFIASYPYDVTPVYDDRPFFFNRVPILRWAGRKLSFVSSTSQSAKLGIGVETLFISLVMTAGCTALLLLLPVVAHRRKARTSGVSTRRGTLWALYFAGLGLGFILVEIVLIQRFSLFLGYPVYSLSVVLFTMLLASGVGSLLAGRLTRAAALRRALVGLCTALVVYAWLLPRVTDAMLGASTSARIAVTVALIAPLGLLMGIPFATGVRRAGAESKDLVPWAWAVNGGSSVFGSTLAVLISMTYGFTASFLCGAVAYALALAVAFVVTRNEQEVAA